MDVRIEHLSKSYGLQKAVDDISFHVKQGEILGFLGPNGAGKTTTMKIITDYLVMDSGNVFIGGSAIGDSDMRKHIGYLPENNPLYDDMPVIDYLAFCAKMQGLSGEAVPRRIREMVRLCGLDPEKHKKINELSKGYRQRVGLAQAMIHDPDILILDEPTTGLDPNQRVEIRDLIKSLGRQKTVILSTHILPEVEATCDRILIINNGRIVADGEVGELKQQAAGGQVIHVSIEDADHDSAFRGLSGLPGVTNVVVRDKSGMKYDVHCKDAVNPSRMIFELCVRHKWTLTELTPVETKLEDVFRDLTMN
jgi:ABC-2 type transport system ATP-binding protein